jgi:hypothetical protein
MIILSGNCLTLAAAETDSLPATANLLAVPGPGLRAQFVQQDRPAPETPPAGVSQTSAFEITSRAGDDTLAAVSRFQVIKLPPPDNLLARGFNSFTSIFEPEEFKVGKTMVSSSITTAIRRKNPLCLLNPIVFNVSW